MILYVAPDAPDIFLWYNPVRKDTLLYIMTVQPWLNGKICLLYG